MDTKEIFEIINHAVQATAILIAGIWAFYTFVLTRAGEWNLELTVEHDVKRYSQDNDLVLLYINLKNVGKVKIEPGQKGCQVSVKEVPRYLKTSDIITWDQQGKVWIDKFDVIHRRKNQGDFPSYSIEPGCQYRELFPVILPKNALVIVETRFWWKDDKDTVTNYTIIDLEEKS